MLFIYVLFCVFCRTSTRHLQSKLQRLLYLHGMHILFVFTACTYSRFTLIVDNTVSLLESREYVDQQMVAEIIGGHTSGHHQQSNNDTLLSHSDFEQVFYIIMYNKMSLGRLGGFGTICQSFVHKNFVLP